MLELLVVIAIIGLLSGIMLMSIQGAREKARRTKADSELQEILKAVMMARIDQDKVLRQITGHTYSAGYCEYYGYTSNACKQRMDITMRAIGFSGAIKDPWGKYYAIDENELEYTWDPCRKDSIISKDYKIIQVPFYSPQCLKF